MIVQSIQYGFQKFQENMAFSLLATISVGVILFFPAIIVAIVGQESGFFTLIMQLIFWFVLICIQIGVYTIGFKVHDGETPEIKNLFSNFELLGSFMLAGILSTVAIQIGFFILIIPGIYISIRLMLWPLCIVDQKTSGMDGLQMAWELSSGRMIELFLFYLLLGIMNFIGGLFVGLGLLVTLPVSIFAITSYYRSIAGGGNLSFTEDFTDPAVISKYKNQNQKFAGAGNMNMGMAPVINRNPNASHDSNPVPEYLREDPPEESKPKTQDKSDDTRFAYDTGTFAPVKTESASKIQLEQTILSIVNFGNKKFKSGDYYGCIQEFTKAIDLEKKNSKHFYSRGTARIKTKDYLGAIEDFTKATKLNPKFARAWFNLGVVKSKIGDPGAKTAIRQAITLDPSLTKLLKKG